MQKGHPSCRARKYVSKGCLIQKLRLRTNLIQLTLALSTNVGHGSDVDLL